MRSVVSSFLLALAFVLASSPPARADEMSRTQADAIISELRQIRLVLEKLHAGEVGRPVPPGPPACLHRCESRRERQGQRDAGNIETLGRSDAPVTIVEFTDYQCPFCRQFPSPRSSSWEHYIDTGKVRYVSRDLPLPNHPQPSGPRKPPAARCAATIRSSGDAPRPDRQRNHLAPRSSRRSRADLQLDVDRFQTAWRPTSTGRDPARSQRGASSRLSGRRRLSSDGRNAMAPSKSEDHWRAAVHRV